jgi:hypothetical protein
MAASVSVEGLVAASLSFIGALLSGREDQIIATPSTNNAAHMASNPVTANSKELHLEVSRADLIFFP